MARTFSILQYHWKARIVGIVTALATRIVRLDCYRKNKRGQSTHARNTRFGLVNLLSLPPPPLSLFLFPLDRYGTIDTRNIFTIRKRLRSTVDPSPSGTVLGTGKRALARALERRGQTLFAARQSKAMTRSQTRGTHRY